MFQTLIFENWGALGLLGVSLAFGLTLYAFVAGLSYYWLFVRASVRHAPDCIPGWRENRKAIRWSMLNIFGNALLILPIQLLIVFGHSRLYGPALERGWGWAAVATVGAILFAESCIYWIHRALHTPALFRWLHRPHHRFRLPTPFVSYAFHPLDSFAQSLPYHAYMFLVPMPEAAYLALIGFASVWTLLIHDQSAWVAPKFINNAGCHTVHHWHYQYNYGNYFTFWDRIAGTYFNPNGLPARFVAAKYDEQRQQYASGTANDQLDLNSLIVPGTLDISG